MLVTLPALPWVSCPRVLLDNNPRLHHLPHLVGCQVQGDNELNIFTNMLYCYPQLSLATYTRQASWAAVAGPVAENILAGVWQLQMYGCGEPPGQGAGLEAGLVTLRLGGATPTLLQLPGRVRRVVAVPSLLELAARRVYSGLLTPGLSLQMRVTEEVHLYIPSLLDSLQNSLYSAQHEDSGLQLASLAPLLPASLLQLLARGPATFCCRPACRGPIFSEV